MPTEPREDGLVESDEVVGVDGEAADSEQAFDAEAEPSCYHVLLTLATLQQCFALILCPAACAFQIYALISFWPNDQATAWNYVAIIMTPFLWGWLLVLALVLSAYLRVVVDKGRRLRALDATRERSLV